MPVVWLNGSVIDEESAAVSVRDTGLLHAAGVFTMMRSYGGKVFNLNLYRLDGSGPGFNLNRSRYLDAWKVDNPNGTQPRLTASPTSVGTDFTDRLLEDGGFLRLRTVTLSRAVPQSWIRGRGIDVARFYVTGQNLHTWSDYSGFNPDVSSLGVGNLNRGIDIGSYPLARTVIVGMNLSY